MLILLYTCSVPQLPSLRESLQAINHDKSDLDAKWDKAVLHDTIGEPRKASNLVWTTVDLLKLCLQSICVNGLCNLIPYMQRCCILAS